MIEYEEREGEERCGKEEDGELIVNKEEFAQELMKRQKCKANVRVN